MNAPKPSQEQLTQSKIDRILHKETTFDQFVEKYKDLEIRNPKILSAVFLKWGKNDKNSSVSQQPLLTEKQKYIDTKRGKELFSMFSSNDLASPEIDWINKKTTTFDDFIEKYKNTSIETPNIIDAILYKWGKNIKNFDASFWSATSMPLLENYSKYIDTSWGQKLFDRYTSKYNVYDKINTAHLDEKLSLLWPIKELAEKEKERLLLNEDPDNAYKFLKIICGHKPYVKRKVNSDEDIYVIEYAHGTNVSLSLLEWTEPIFKKYGDFINEKTKRQYGDIKKGFFEPGLEAFFYCNNIRLENTYKERKSTHSKPGEVITEQDFLNMRDNQQNNRENNDYNSYIEKHYLEIIALIKELGKGARKWSVNFGNEVFQNEEGMEQVKKDLNKEGVKYEEGNIEFYDLSDSGGVIFHGEYSIPEKYPNNGHLTILFYPNYAIIKGENIGTKYDREETSRNSRAGRSYVKNVENILGRNKSFIGTRDEVLKKIKAIQKVY